MQTPRSVYSGAQTLFGRSVCTLLLITAWLIAPSTSGGTSFQATRLNDAKPIITKQHFLELGAPAEEGENINGPTVIRVPDWIPGESRASAQAKYYMYFAHHKGAYIRLAWAETVEGPWHLHNTGRDVAVGKRGVLDMGPDRELDIGNSLSALGHIASPDIHVDHDNKRIAMFFHGKASYKGEKIRRQKSFAAFSDDGLDFSSGLIPVLLSGSYLRVFTNEGNLQGLQRTRFVRPEDPTAPWWFDSRRTPDKEPLWLSSEAKFLQFAELALPNGEPFAKHRSSLRHLALYRRGPILYVFFTLKGHAPERILVTQADLRENCWYCAAPQVLPEEVLRPEKAWEGSEIPARASKRGPAWALSNALRDPFVFEDEGEIYLFYVGGGESAIGVSRLQLLAK